MYVTLEGECNYIRPSTDMQTRLCIQSDVRYFGRLVKPYLDQLWRMDKAVCLFRCTLLWKVSVTILRPALVYGLGGVFSQMYRYFGR